MEITTKKYQMFIDGEFVNSSSQETLDVVNPATEEIISEIPRGTIGDVRAAIDSAKRAQKKWKKTPAFERGNYLLENLQRNTQK